MKIDREILTSAMKNSISNVLEIMFFLPVDFDNSIPLSESWDLDKDKIIVARLDFDGPLSGYCTLCIPEKLLVSITADFMGKEEKEISSEQARGTLMEINNMITGNVFSLYDPETVFDLGVPKLVGLDDFRKDFNDSEDRISIAIDTLENRLAFQMNIRIDD